MVRQMTKIALGLLIASSPLAAALSPSDIPADTPVSKIISSATAALAKGDTQEALTYFDAAVSRDPQNYLTLFRRGATHLQLGKHSQANHDFDRVLAIKPNFEGALVQRAKLKSRLGDWEGAKKDYKAAGKQGGEEVMELEEAQKAEKLSAEAENNKDWGACTSNADVAVHVASGSLDLRRRRAKCRFEKGEIEEGLSDLLHVAQLTSSEEVYLKLSATYFYALNELDNGLAQIRTCMHRDPDSKACRKLLKGEKAINKRLKKVRELMGKRQYNSASKLLVKTGEDEGLISDVKSTFTSLQEAGTIPSGAPTHLHNSLLELTCDAYSEMNSPKRATPYCNEVLTFNPTHLSALITKATTELSLDDHEAALRTLNKAQESHGQNQRIAELHQKATVALKRSKQKDYYAVLGLTRDADTRDIKRAYRKLSVKYHPDKASQLGVTPEQAQTKMAAINEAYEVLSDPELKQRFDAGDDPNDNSQQQGGPFQGSPFGGGFPGGQQQFVFQQGGGPGRGFKFQAGGQGGFNFPGGFPF